MIDDSQTGLRSRVPDLRLAAASIGGFWLFYFLTIVIRMALLEESFHSLEWRGLGCLVGVLLTFLVYLVLRIAADESLTIKIIVGAISCIPAAAIFSTFNLAFAVHQPLVTRTLIAEKEGERTVLKLPKDREADHTEVPRMPTRVMLPESVRRERTARLIADGLVTWYLFFAAWASFYLALSSGVQLRTAERRAARAERDAQAAQLRALRYQVNPHFLFNTLNSLSSLVMARRENEAESMIVNLSTFFRSSLAIDPTEDVTLKEEIGFQRLYLDIETVRFPNRLRVVTDIPDDLAAARVPPLILQPVVENAIKHGVARTAEPVTLTILAREEDGRLLLVVENDRGPAADGRGEVGTGVGLANVRDRLAARFGPEAECEDEPLPDGGYRVILSMPLEM
jgi:two-component system LytT family sensor kinase